MTDKGTINIIGNGFDIAHGLKTSYWDFWDHLKKCDSPEMIFICKKILPNLENLWSSLEENIPAIINNIYLYCLKTDSVTFEANKLNFDQRKSAYYICIQLWREFHKWIVYADWDPYQPSIRKIYKEIKDHLFNSEQTTVINFNYTDSPSYIYIPVNDIYVHGTSNDKNSIIFGHPNSENWEDIEADLKTISLGKSNPLFPARYKADKDAIKRTYGEIFKTQWAERFVKNYDSTIPIFKENLGMFCKYPETEIINVFGHSFGELDDKYFNEILIHLNSKNEKPVWNLYYHSPADLAQAKRLVRKLHIKKVKYIPSQKLLGEYEEIKIPVVRH